MEVPKRSTKKKTLLHDPSSFSQVPNRHLSIASLFSEDREKKSAKENMQTLLSSYLIKIIYTIFVLRQSHEKPGAFNCNSGINSGNYTSCCKLVYHVHKEVFFYSVFRSRDILVRIRIRGSLPLTYGIQLRILFFSSVTFKTSTKNKFFAYYFLKVHLHHYSKIKSHKEVKKE